MAGQTRHPDSRFLLTDAQLGDEGTIALDVLLLEVVQEAAALTDHLQQATVGVLVRRIVAHVLGELVDALGENGDLDLGRAGVRGMSAVGVDDSGLLFLTKHG